MDCITPSLAGQPPIAQDLIDAIKATGDDWGEIGYSVSNERVPDHRLHFADRDAAKRLHEMMDKAGVNTVLNTWADALPHVVIFTGATRGKKAIRYLRNGRKPRKPTGKAARAKQKQTGRKMDTGIAALPMTKTEAKGLVKEILSDAKQLAAKLQELRDRLGWKALGYDSWAECVEREFGYSKRHANRLIAAQNTRDEVGPIGPTQTPGSGELPESHARELGRLPNDQRADCYRDFIDECEQAGAKPTAAGLRERVESWLADDEPYIDAEDDEAADDDYIQCDETAQAYTRAKAACHVSQNTGYPEWYTPDEYLDAARTVTGAIDLDPATSEIAQARVRATRFFTVADDGLSRPWSGRVWLNPPYTAGLVDKFIGKLTEHYAAGDVEAAIALVNNATDTGWLQDAAAKAAVLCFPRGRVRFLDESGEPKGAPLQGLCLLYFGDDKDRFIEVFGQFGFCAEVETK